MSGEYGTYIVTIENTGDPPHATIVKRIEETDEAVNELALHLEVFVEEGLIESFSIEGQNLPPLATEGSLYTEILTRFWHAGVSDSILSRSDLTRISQTWEQGWRNRDAYFTRNAKANIKAGA